MARLNNAARQMAPGVTAPAGPSLARKALRAEKHGLKRRLLENEMHGLFDFVSQGFSIVKDLAPAAIKANVEKRIAATQAKTAARASSVSVPAAPVALAPAPLPASAPAPAMGWKVPALVGGGVLLSALVLPRLLPQGPR